MDAIPEAVDRRAALKARSRQAILDAAAELMERHRSVDFTVDDLAAAADVSRRTVFNHFASLDDVVTEAAGQMLVEIVDRMEARAASGSREAGTVLDDLAATASADHLVPTVAYLIEVLGRDDPRRGDREAVLMQRAFSLFTERMSGAIARRHREADPLGVDLLVAAFGGGLLVMANRWMDETGGESDTPESRRLWDELVARLTAVLREPDL
ncbi:TetR/AcrR family transcriptional regulator [Glycomyces salinus]|uniref:TetR/AcrR family transcriptional regulator n=1 Tax=Glycomyces salinus TaxID=980294 RepID=UPI0018EC275A|nr:TetR/AcrR family transcriptional regulator [Glycomyces salinus]